MKTHLGIIEKLRACTANEAEAELMFDHWGVIPGDPLDASSKAGELVLQTRKRKGLKNELPDPQDFMQKL